MKVFGRKAEGARLERMQDSPRWVDGQFRNIHPVIDGLKKNVAMPLWEFFCPKEQRRPLTQLPTINPLPTWSETPETDFRVTVLGHSTVYFEIDGIRILTDPVWGSRASPFESVGPVKRFQPVPVAIEDLPRPDVILLSHDHYDHLDYPTILRLADTDIPFVTSLGIGAHLEYWGVTADRITEIDWWEKAEPISKDLSITATPAQHFSGRGPGQTGSTLWSSFVIETPKRRVFFGADTGLTFEYNKIADHFGTFDLALLEIGAYHPSWGDIHLGPENAPAALELLGKPPLIPIHWGTFDLAMHRWDQPIERLMQIATERDIRLIAPIHGEPTEPDLYEQIDPWWRGVSALHASQESSPGPVEGAEEDFSPVD